jgi:hypothetical protein
MFWAFWRTYEMLSCYLVSFALKVIELFEWCLISCLVEVARIISGFEIMLFFLTAGLIGGMFFELMLLFYLVMF